MRRMPEGGRELSMGGLTQGGERERNARVESSVRHERPQIMSEEAEERGVQHGGKTEECKKKKKKSPQLFSTSAPKPSTHRSVPPRTPTSYYFPPMLLSSENRPEARSSLGWLTLQQSPCSSHACNNLSLLKKPRLLEGSTRTPPPLPFCIPGIRPSPTSLQVHAPPRAVHFTIPQPTSLNQTQLLLVHPPFATPPTSEMQL